MMGECQNVQTYAAAQVFYWTGINGTTYVLDIFIADTSLLKNRMIWIAITGSPYICNTFAGPELGQLFLRTTGWRWGYRTFAIITPFISMPFWTIFFMMSRRVDKMGIIKRQKVNRTVAQSIVHWCVEFDGESNYPSSYFRWSLTSS
jgi:MFS family permease